MKAWVIREERHGDPIHSMKLEEVPTPEPGPGEVLIRVKAAGVNYNHIWACLGKPLPISRLHPQDPLHIGGSDASGTVEKLGTGVKKWKVGDEIIVHPNQTCGQCAACNGFEPLLCKEQKAWGFETSWGSFGEFALVQAQQLLPKPKSLSWEEASCYGLKLFTAYRMLMVQGKLFPNERVLIWGASGGLGSYAIQLCLAVNAIPICVTSSPSKADYCRSLGAKLIIDRSQFPHLADGADPCDTKGMSEFRKVLRSITGGLDPDIVFEHVGKNTFPTSVFTARKRGKIVICGATTGYNLQFDVRHLWMHQKKIIGSHGCNAHDATRANHMIENGIIKPTLTRTFDFNETHTAHQLVLDNQHIGSWAISGLE